MRQERKKNCIYIYIYIKEEKTLKLRSWRIQWPACKFNEKILLLVLEAGGRERTKVRKKKRWSE